MKVVKLDTKLDPTKIADAFLSKEPSAEEHKIFQDQMEEWAKDQSPEKGPRPELKRERMSVTEFFRDVVSQAIRQVHKSATVEHLRRSNKIIEEFNAVSADPSKEGIVTLSPDDFDYVRKAFRKADDWKNTPEIAKAILAVDAQIEKAVEIEA